MSALTDRIAEVLTGLHVDPSSSVCGCYELTPEDAAHVAERIEAELQLTEETRVSFVSHFDGAPVRRWVSAWSEVLP